MFYGRESELADLEEWYSEPCFHFIIVYGRRRVGKTELLSHFVAGKDAIYYTATEQNDELLGFSRAIQQFKNERLRTDYAPAYPSFEAAFEDVFDLARSNRTILVLDEYPYLARSCVGLDSVLQKLVDKYHHTSKLMLILCGSSVSYIENNLMAYSGPLHGRLTGHLKLGIVKK